MIKRPSATEPRAPLSASTAFVVHLTTDSAGVPETLQGRVEHVRSGESLRFGSVADLVRFMQRVLANPLQSHADETMRTRASSSSDEGSFAASLPRSMRVDPNAGARKDPGKALRRLFLLAMALGVAAGARPAAAVSCGGTGVFYDVGENPDYANAEAQCVYRTPGLDTFTVPPYWPQLGLDAYGAGNGKETGFGGWNGTATDLVAVGQVFDIRVGGQPFGSGPGIGLGVTCDVGGFNGGGNSGDRFSACGGAGASDVRPQGGSLSDRFVVGGGGGGSIYAGFLELGIGVLAQGGAGGGASGSDGVAEHGCVTCGDPGGGGNQFGGGPSPGNASSAGFGFGGAGGTAVPSVNDGGAGGGGGWYGGGGSGAAFNPGSGGGGSGYPGQGAQLNSLVNNGNGQVIVTLFRLFEPLAVTVTLTSDHANPVAAGSVVQLTAKVAINSGAAPAGKVVFTDSAGSHSAQLGVVYLDQDGEYALTVNASSIPNGPHHNIVATFVDGYQFFPDTNSSALALDVSAAAQTITFTSTAPSNAQAFGPPYTVTATASSGLPVSLSIAVDSASATVCTLTGSVVSFVAPGTCNILANQAGNGVFDPAPQALQSITVTPLTGTAQTIYFTSTPPSNPHPNDTYMATASGGGSGKPVVFAAPESSRGTCTVTATGQVTFTGGGPCTITADQAGGNGFAAAAQASQEITVVEPYVVTFETTPPSGPQIGDTYTVTAHASHGLASTLTLDAGSSGCTLTGVTVGNRGLGGKFSSGTVSFTGYGPCIVNGNQSGFEPYFPSAQQVQQRMTLSPPTPTVTPTVPTATRTASATFTATATSSMTATATQTPQASSTATASTTAASTSIATSAATATETSIATVTTTAIATTTPTTIGTATTSATPTPTATPSAAETVPATPVIALPQPQLCYWVNAPQQRFDAIEVTVADALGTARGVVQRPAWLCGPADLNGADPTAPTALGSFVGYRLRLTAKPRPAARHTVSNAFGSQTVAVDGHSSLLMPSTQQLNSAPTAPSLPAVDHFACYGARAVHVGGRNGTQQTVTLQDRFGAYGGALGRATRLCLPADINGTSPGAPAHPDALLCYRLRSVRHVNVGRVFTADDRGTATLVPRFTEELCLPSIIQ